MPSGFRCTSLVLAVTVAACFLQEALAVAAFLQPPATAPLLAETYRRTASASHAYTWGSRHIQLPMQGSLIQNRKVCRLGLVMDAFGPTACRDMKENLLPLRHGLMRPTGALGTLQRRALPLASFTERVPSTVLRSQKDFAGMCA